eukprot:1014616-Amorphochlora_amoeboformis.AAC.1
MAAVRGVELKALEALEALQLPEFDGPVLRYISGALVRCLEAKTKLNSKNINVAIGELLYSFGVVDSPEEALTVCGK